MKKLQIIHSQVPQYQFWKTQPVPSIGKFRPQMVEAVQYCKIVPINMIIFIQPRVLPLLFKQASVLTS